MTKRMIVALLMGSLVPLISFGEDLFKDTFNRPGSPRINENLPMGQRGKLIPMPWDEHTKTPGKPAAKISANHLLISNKGNMSAASVRHNFIDSSIYDNGGFRVRMEISAFKTKAIFMDAPEDYYCGFGVGIEGRGLARWTPHDQAFSVRGASASKGTSSFWVGLGNPRNPEIQIRSMGVVLKAIPVDSLTGVLDATFHLYGFEKGDKVTVYLRYNDQTVDLNGSSEGTSRTFRWNATDSNYIALEARATDNVQISEFTVGNIAKRYDIKRSTKKKVVKEVVTSKEGVAGVFGFALILLLLFRRPKAED